MGPNTFGVFFKCHSFGESHGLSMGVIVEGCPAGLTFSLDVLKNELNRRRPGKWPWVSARKELDEPEILSGVFEGKTLGTPIAILIRNTDAIHSDYESIRKNPRPGHADDLWKDKFGHSDYRGGGRSSGRETINRVVAGAVARMFLKKTCPNFKVMAFVRQIGKFQLNDEELKETHALFDKNKLSETFPACFPSQKRSEEVVHYLMESKKEGESLGSVVELWMDHLPRGLGQPVFHKFKSDLAQGLMSLGATAGFEIGAGFLSGLKTGKAFHEDSKNYGGVRGGLTTGERVCVRVAFKPPSSLGKVAQKGRHDPCIGIRAVPVVEAMAYFVTADHILRKRMDRI